MLPPRRVLLATDFSARSDRAEARAVSLARQYDAELLVLHVLENTKRLAHSRRMPFTPTGASRTELVETAKRRQLDAVYRNTERTTVRLEAGDAPEVILRLSDSEGCDMIVTGVARNEVLGRFTLGRTVDRLMRSTKTPLLVVTDRVVGPYSRVVVASDFSEASRQALEGAAALFPQQSLTVLHAHGSPGAYAVDDQEGYREEMRLVARNEYTAFLDSIRLPDEQRARFAVLIESGNLLTLLRDLVQKSAIDLVVLGSRPRGVLSGALIGSVAKRVVADLPCDALVIRGLDA